MFVLQEIRRAGTLGTWTKTLKYTTRLPAQTIAKTLKTLESRKLVKSVKSVKVKNKKVYIAFDLEPDRAHTGGPWYSDLKFDEKFVGIIRELVLAKMAEEPRGVTLSELRAYFHTEKMGHMLNESKLEKRDLHQVVESLRFERVVEEFVERDPTTNAIVKTQKYDLAYETKDVLVPEKRWKLAVFCTSEVGFTREFPCGKCALIDSCVPGGVISPSTCAYMNEWTGVNEDLQF